ncbi:hypothetical protein BDE02_17G049900 [Populus trichocarpa]|nr:hypothetical protein BDE02_17G049900 [Populus trichocarpa]
MLDLLFFHDMIKPCLILTSRTDRLIFLIDEECSYADEYYLCFIVWNWEHRELAHCMKRDRVISLYLLLFLFNSYKLLIEYFSINSSLLAATRRSASSLSLMMMSFTLPYYFQ